MEFLAPTLETAVEYMNRLESNTTPLWGNFRSQAMIEHLSDTVALALGEHSYPLSIPEDKIEKAQSFIDSDKEMPKNFSVSFVNIDAALRNADIALAIDEFVLIWLKFEEFFTENPTIKTLHPNFGELNYSQWKRLHSKHLTHHFQQFGLIPA